MEEEAIKKNVVWLGNKKTKQNKTPLDLESQKTGSMLGPWLPFTWMVPHEPLPTSHHHLLTLVIPFSSGKPTLVFLV